MTKITIYDDDNERIDAICNEREISDAQLIQALLDAVEDGTIDLDEYI